MIVVVWVYTSITGRTPYRRFTLGPEEGCSMFLQKFESISTNNTLSLLFALPFTFVVVIFSFVLSHQL
jgi:hypothetical protein